MNLLVVSEESTSKRVLQKVDLQGQMSFFTQFCRSLLVHKGKSMRAEVIRMFFPLSLWLLQDMTLLTDGASQTISATEARVSAHLFASIAIWPAYQSLCTSFPSVECAGALQISITPKVMKNIVEQQDQLRPAFQQDSGQTDLAASHTQGSHYWCEYNGQIRTISHSSECYGYCFWCVVICSHHLCTLQVDHAFAEATKFFTLPVESKLKYGRTPDTKNNGYISLELLLFVPPVDHHGIHFLLFLLWSPQHCEACYVHKACVHYSYNQQVVTFCKLDQWLITESCVCASYDVNHACKQFEH